MSADLTTSAALIARYDVFVLDAWGVLLDDAGPREGAAAFVQRLRDAGKTIVLLSNDASSTPTHLAQRMAKVGILAQEIVSGATLLVDAVARHGLGGKRCMVLGTRDAHANVTASGAVPVKPDNPGGGFDAFIVSSESGFTFPDDLDAALTALFRELDGRDVPLLLSNPDLFAPTSPSTWGIAAGAVAALIEAVLQQRYPGRALRFEQLGKPSAHAFAAAMARAACSDKTRVVMVGDQIRTDIVGANRFGIASAWLADDNAAHGAGADETPTWRLTSL